MHDEGEASPCGEFEVCKNEPEGFRCINLEEKFENGDPTTLIVSSNYRLTKYKT